MTLTERCKKLSEIFDMLQSTNSITVKRSIVDMIDVDLRDDFQICLEVLIGKIKFGYRWSEDEYSQYMYSEPVEDWTMINAISWLREPQSTGNLTDINILLYCSRLAYLSWFFEPLVNREIKLGIGQSILPKDSFSPMLAKKFDGYLKYDYRGYFITEKLDGNRCIASYENGKWVFKSRNGKLMHVNFDMSDLPTEYVYDGEVMSRKQTEQSIDRCGIILKNRQFYQPLPFDSSFNETSGLINRHALNKDLLYNIFDIMIDDVPYEERRQELDRLYETVKYGSQVRIVPVLAKIERKSFTPGGELSCILDSVTSMQGEGLMINLGSGFYHHKRTDQLLKLKRAQTIDMEVIEWEWGKGKYEGQVGAITCQCRTDDKIIYASVGSGLSDEQRLQWTDDSIIGKIVEIEYFSLSQNQETKGTNIYSLRFPRLKRVRTDKTETSEF